MRCSRTTAAFGLIQLIASARALPSLLVFSATTGFRHESIPGAIEVLRSQAASQNVSLTFTEDQNEFNNDNLAQYDGLLFLMTSGQDVLNGDQQTAFNDYLRSGGAYIGVHSASDCLQNTAFYNQTVGAIFDYHPPIQQATFLPVTRDHPATANFPDEWRYASTRSQEEEVYFFRSDPRRNGATVILTVDVNSFEGNYPSQGDPHPIAWFIESPQSAEPLMDGAPKAGRSFYTSLGHLDSTWQDDRFLDHLFGGLQWALDGASTRAFGVGIVGNSTEASVPTSSPSSSVSSTASSPGSTTGSSSSSASSSAASATSSPNAAASDKKSVAGQLVVGLACIFIGIVGAISVY